MIIRHFKWRSHKTGFSLVERVELLVVRRLVKAYEELTFHLVLTFWSYLDRNLLNVREFKINQVKWSRSFSEKNFFM